MARLWKNPRFLALVFLAHSFAYAAVPYRPSCAKAWLQMALGTAPRTADSIKRNFLSTAIVDPHEIATFAAESYRFDRPDRLVFHVENAVLKSLKEKILKDGELAVALTGLYKQIVFRLLEDNPDLASKLYIGEDGTVARYADFKGLRLLFRENNQELRVAVNKLYHDAERIFAERVKSIPEIRAKLAGLDDRLRREPEWWHLAGFGSSAGNAADEAATAARVQRYWREENVDRLPTILDFNDPRVLRWLDEKVLEVEARRKGLQETLVPLLGPDSKLLSRLDDLGGRFVLSAEMIDILRDVPAANEAEYIAFVTKRIRERFGVKIPREHEVDAVRAMQRYFHLVDVFSPGIFQQKEVTDLGLSRAPYGVVAIDQVALSPDNYRATMERLVMASSLRGQHPGDLARSAVHYTRKGQDDASRRVSERMNTVLEAPQEAGLTGDERFSPHGGFLISGDDMVFAPGREMTDADRLRLLRVLSTKSSPAKLRVAFGRSGGDIDQGYRFEKLFRKELERRSNADWPVPEALKKLALGVHFENGEFTLYFAGPFSKTNVELKRAAAAVIAAEFSGAKLREIHFVEAPYFLPNTSSVPLR